ncbi:MAG: TRAP transporter substrate-binding protein [Hyphomicrobiaceae bacterium]|nr:TRAP transporter substrate-binding protein [Hyphomicrobiaceae bacterium]
MRRRAFLKSAAAGAVAATAATATASGLAAPALSQGLRKWRMVTTWPKNLPGVGTGAQYFADQVTKCTGGRITVELFAAGEIVPPFEAIDAVRSGTVEMCHGSPYYWKGKATAVEIVSNFPFGLTAQEYNAWYHFGGGAALCDELYASAFGAKFLLCGGIGVQQFGWARREIGTLADFKGLKMRLPGLGGEVMRRLGATVVNMPAGDVPQALASGAIDWAEWTNPYGEAAMGFWRHAKFYYGPGWHEPGSCLEVSINQKLWEALEPDLKAIIEQCAFATNSIILSEFQARSGPILQQFVDKYGVELRRLTDEQLTTLGSTAAEILAEITAKDAFARKAFASMNAFRGAQRAFSNITERDYLNARALAYTWPG